MFSFLINCTKHFGLLNGLRIYIQIKILKSQSFKIPGYEFPVYLRPHTSDITSFREIFFKEEYNIQVSSFLKPKAIIDAGANVGYTSLVFAHRFPEAKIIALEPEKGNYNCLTQNVKNYTQIIPSQSALWYKKGTIELMDEGHGNRGFTVSDQSKTSTVSTIPCTTLMDLMAEYNFKHIDILKMDIEGSEKEVLSIDSAKWLPLTKYFIIEVHDRMKDGCSKALFNAIGKYNFELSIRGENLIFINKDLT